MAVFYINLCDFAIIFNLFFCKEICCAAFLQQGVACFGIKFYKQGILFLYPKALDYFPKWNYNWDK